jgi:hypothetical protein
MKPRSRIKWEGQYVLLFVTQHILLFIGLPTHFIPNTIITDSGATCHMCGSLKGMFNQKPFVTEIMAENNDTMLSFYKGNLKGLVVQRDGPP